MAVSRAVLVVIVVAVTQVECASITKPEPPVGNHVDVPESTDLLETHEDGPKKKTNGVPLENQVKLEKLDIGQPPDGDVLNPSSNDGVMTNSHTLTSEDFAAMTGVGSLEPERVDSKPPESPGSPTLNSKNDERITPSPDKSVTSQVDTENPINPENVDSNMENTHVLDSSDSTNSEYNDDQSHSDDGKQSLTGDIKDDCSPDDNECSLSLEELSQNISDEIKMYSNKVAIHWEGKKERTSWTIEAESVLRDYLDKISIAQSANNSNCVKKDLENHASRSKSLQDVMDSCKSELIREEWHKLQEITKQTLNQILDIVQGASVSIGKILKDDPMYSTKKEDIEQKAKKKLQELHSKDLKNTFSELKDKTIQSDENEYNSCLDNKPEKEMIVDTLNDIMRIKNNCVG